MKKAFIGNGGHLREVIAHTKFDVIRFVEDEYFKDEELLMLKLVIILF